MSEVDRGVFHFMGIKCLANIGELSAEAHETDWFVALELTFITLYSTYGINVGLV